MKLVFQKTKSKLATVMVTFDAGARAEGKKYNAGIAHMLEHMIFKGTQKRDYLQIPMEIASMGGATNAYTSLEQVTYYITAPLESLEQSFDILSDMVFNSTFPEDEFLKEREVVKEECLAGNDSIDSVVYHKFLETLYSDRASKPVIGYPETIDMFTRDELVSFYKEFYVPENCIVAVSADVKKDVVLNLANKYMGKIDGKFAGLSVKKQKQKRKKEVTVTKDGLQQAYVFMTFDAPLDKKKEGLYEIFFQIFGSGMDSRLFTEVREKLGLCYGVSSGLFSHRHSSSVLVNASTRPEKVSEMVDVINREIKRMKTELVSEEELSRAKNKWRSGNYAQMESSRAMLQDSNHRAYFKKLPLKTMQKSVPGVTAQDILDVANELFDFDKSQLFVYKTDGETAEVVSGESQ